MDGSTAFDRCWDIRRNELKDSFGSIRAGRRRVQFGHNPPFSERGNMPFERLHYSGT